ncbi:MAG: polyphosphate kinase 2 [Saprospiraceae bacterium]
MTEFKLSDYYQISTKYWEELYLLQVELLKLQMSIFEQKQRIAILFEGRDAAGKGGAIFRFTQYMNPRQYRVVALGKPTKQERDQWYFQRYIKELPNPGEIVFFDRSWYNRAVVEPVMGFCTNEQYDLFMKQAPLLEQMLVDDGVTIIKFWFSIKIEEQKHRIEERITSPLKRWKVSPVDLLAIEKWHEYTRHKEMMFQKTHQPACPWIIVNGNDKELARLNSIRYVLSQVDYPDKTSNMTPYDPEIVHPFSSF